MKIKELNKLTNKELLKLLENDYENMMKFLFLHPKFKREFNKEEGVRLFNILEDNCFFFTKETPLFLRSNVVAFVASAYVDEYATLTYFNYDINLDDEKKDLIYQIICDAGISFGELSETMVLDPYFLNKSKISKHAQRFLKKLSEGAIYNKEDELKLLKYLNSECKTIDDYIRELIEAYKMRSDLNILQVYGIGYYIKKVLHQEGIDDYQINLFRYSDDDSLGEHDGENKKIILYNVESPVEELLEVLFHEVEHAIQAKAMQELDIDRDIDFDKYVKDSFLADICENYYQDNYFRISYELDAEIKAKIKIKKFVNDYPDIKEIITGLIEEHNYENTLIRVYKNKKYDLEALFLLKLKEHLLKEEKNKEELIKKYPYIKYEYDLERVVKKSYKTLLLEYKKSEGKEKIIYEKIIAKRKRELIDKAKEKKVLNKETILTEELKLTKYLEYLEGIIAKQRIK